MYRPFITLDGEGAKDEYILLASSDGKSIQNRQGLSTEECLDFLLSLPRGDTHGRKPIYAWFAFDYDVNMILRDVPLKGPDSIAELREYNSIRWRGYKITYIRRKILRIARGNKRHTSYDLHGFFQTSFENSLTNWGIESSEVITAGKASRKSFDRWSMRRIAEYNDAELDRLTQLAEALRESVAPLELPIQSWHGPAALAAAWLRKQNAKQWYAPTPPEMMDAATRGYYGGRIDVVGYGIVDPVYHYDIISAYPSAIRFLPDLTKLRWRLRHGKPPSGRIYLARIEWEIPARYWCVFPWRDRHGTILWPPKGEGWYWQSEVEAAIEKFGKQHFRFKESWIADGDYEFPFGQLINDTFAYRAKLKAEKNPSHVAVKLILNSLYGKFAQTVGNSPYFSPIWAGLITAYTRAQLGLAITDDVVCVMTDSIWSRKPLNLAIGSQLGEWEEQEESRLWLAEAGLYEAEKPDGNSFVWQRGFDKRNPVDIRGLVSNWIGDDPSYTPIYTVNRFVGMGLASSTHLPWRKWVDIQRKIEPVPFAGTTKRLPHFPLDSNVSGDKNFVYLSPRARDELCVSYPYSKITLDPNLVLKRLEDECDDSE